VPVFFGIDLVMVSVQGGLLLIGKLEPGIHFHQDVGDRVRTDPEGHRDPAWEPGNRLGRLALIALRLQ
jgi:hypothetical protein